MPSLHADFATLCRYIEAGFEVYPCVQNRQTGAYLPIQLNGQLGLYPSEVHKARKERHGITDLKLLQALVTQRQGITNAQGYTYRINLFRFFPMDHHFLVLDIDTHEGKASGRIQWDDYLKHHKFSHWCNLETFPCHVKTPNGGIHLYFRLPGTPPTDLKDLASSIEVSRKDKPITAAGSTRKGTLRSHYELYGDFSQAPYLPHFLYQDILLPQSSPLPKNATPFSRYKPYNHPSFPFHSRKKWNQTLEGIAEKARERCGGNHDFVVHICRYAKKTNEAHEAYYTKAELEAFLFAQPEVIDHERKDRGDTRGVLKSYFG